jgi:hypothetical protein
MKGAGWKKISEFEWKGAKYPIQVNVGNGCFKIEVPTKDPTEPKRFVGKDLEDLRKEVKSHVMQETELKWEPMIRVFNDAGSRGELDLQVDRFWKAVQGDGKILWRHDKGNYAKEPELGRENLEERDHPSKRGTLTSYNKDDWAMLRNLQEAAYRMHEIVDVSVRQDNMPGLLEVLREGGFELLMKNPKRLKIQGSGYHL